MHLKRPTLLIDKQKCLANIRLFVVKAVKYNLRFRPHFKTHQSVEVGSWFREFGIDKITVSSVMMAEYFAKNGWNDITIAFPVNIAETDEINILAKQIKLNLLVENVEAVGSLSRTLKNPVGVYVKIDTGYHRSGIEVEKYDAIADLINIIRRAENLNFKGLLAHNGLTYLQSTPDAICKVHDESLTKLKRLKDSLKKAGINPEISIGDTPAVSLCRNFEDVDEIRPGNFVFYDLMQQELGVCRYDQIAVALACPIVAVHVERLEVVIWGGAAHLSKEALNDEGGGKVFGKVVLLDKFGWTLPLDGTFVKSVSQEHGIIKTTPEHIDKFSPGVFIGILPVHSCLTTIMIKEILTLNGEVIHTMNC
ncbi:MAG TPA: alanine racemase [Bacteroidales bacterium]|nr:alanine racemase [Bacteroidales bacterium]